MELGLTTALGLTWWLWGEMSMLDGFEDGGPGWHDGAGVDNCTGVDQVVMGRDGHAGGVWDRRAPAVELSPAAAHTASWIMWGGEGS